MDDEAPPPVWRLTPLARSLVDFDIMLDSRNHGSFFRNAETIRALHDEQKRVETRTNILYLLTFIGALIVVSGPLPEGAKIAAFGFEAPLAALPQQVIATLTAGLFGYYCTNFCSMILLQQMGRKILIKEGQESWQFFAAPFDASSIWTVLITPKLIGYKSPKREIVLALAIFLMATAIVIAHAVIVISATALAFRTALETGSTLLIFLGGAALTITSVSTLAVLAGALLPMPYRHDPEAAKSRNM